MNTLKAIAATYGLYQLADIPAQWSGDYCRKDGGREVPEFLKTLKGYEAGNFFECKIQGKGTPKELYFIEYHTHILIKKDGSDLLLLLREDSRSKKYWLHPYYSVIDKYRDIDHNIRQDALKELKEPNQIGVFTLNKIEAWVIYCENYIRIMEQVFAEVSDKNAAIEKKIKDFIDSLKGCEVTKWDNRTTVKTELFEVRFEHYKNQKYLNTKIEFTGSLENIVKIHNKTMLVEC